MITTTIPTKREVGQALRAHRRHLRLSAGELAHRLVLLGCDTTASSIYNTESGERPMRLDEALALVEVFDLDGLDALLDGGRMERERKAAEAAARVAELEAELEAARRSLVEVTA